MQEYTQLKVWEKAHQLTLKVYRATSSFPRDELFGLTSQLRRSAASIGANLAEGCGRGSDPDFARFVQMALGSAYEVQYHLLLAKDLGYLKATSQQSTDDNNHESLNQGIVEIKRMLSSLLQTLKGAS
ncbi:MAG: four helix bundle protein [Gemmatales bacterium]